MSFRDTWGILKKAGQEWLNDDAMRLSAAIAFYTILSIAPLILIAVAIAGAVFGQDAATGAITDELRAMLGDAGAEVAKTALANADRPAAGTFATIFGVAMLLFGASGVFRELQATMNIVWNVKPKPGRGVWGFIRDRFLSFGMVLVVGFLLLVSLIISTGLAAMGKYVAGLAPGVPVLMQVANFVIGFAVVTVLFALVFKFLPDAKVAWRDVWFGAAVTAVLFTVGKYAIGMYLGRAGVGTPFGAAGSLVAFVVWVYYSGLIVLFGAELTQVTAEFAGRKIEPTENAMPANPNLAKGVQANSKPAAQPA
jgi:membrane protein